MDQVVEAAVLLLRRREFKSNLGRHVENLLKTAARELQQVYLSSDKQYSS